MKELPQHLLIGLSGGADSVALLRLLLEKGNRLSAVHVNHGLRGAESDGDEDFVRELCRAYHVPLYCFRADLPADASEDECRRARYAFFHRAMTESGADALALAHHRDDQAEVFLLHLLRGAGTAGLSGMAEDSVMDGMRIVRPLLGYTRQELRDMLGEWHQAWREDSSNASEKYLRNAIRHELLPLMERLSPGASGRIASAAELIRTDSRLIRRQTDDFLEKYAGADWIMKEPLLELPDAMRRAVIRRWWEGIRQKNEELGLTREQTEQILLLLEGSAGSGCPLPERKTARLTRHCLAAEPGRMPKDLSELPAEDGAVIAGVTVRISKTELPGSERLPGALLRECTVRTQRCGDYIIPFGWDHPQEMKEYLKARHVEALFRERVPLLCRGHEVLLAAGVGTGGIPREQADPVYLAWNGKMPWKE